LLWAVAAAASVQLAPNPLYVAVVIAVAALVVETHRVDSDRAAAFGLLLTVGVAFSLLRVVLMVLTTRGDGETIATLPQATLPTLLGGFSVGGPLSWSVLWQTAAEGLVVVGVMAVFGAFNTVASHHELLQAAPRAFHEPGVVVTVGLAFIPSTVAAVGTVREADQARTGGRVVRRGRLVRLVLPVLETGMERAVGLAESMDARGFGRGRPTGPQRAAGWFGLVTLLGLGGSLVALIGSRPGIAAVSVAVGVGALVAAVTLASRGSGTTRYRVRSMGRVDWSVLAVTAMAPVGLAVLAAVGDESLRWTVSFPVVFPAFHPGPVAVLALLAVPALVPRRGLR
jgi:energy-coupling factor transport system permease protein